MEPTIRGRLEIEEDAKLHPRAARSRTSAGRQRVPDACPIRLAYQVDRDRILHSKSFRRLGQKTQVFLAPTGDHYRTRLTHTLEVSQIARTLARALGLNEDLTEAVALGHDIGHTPFGHAGESVLNRLCPEGFHHARQSLRVVDELERDGQGLNLTAETRDGIRNHSKGKGEIYKPLGTLEAEAVRLADLIAYLNHDLDDALRAGVVARSDIPARVRDRLGVKHGERISTIVENAVAESQASGLARVAVSEEMNETLVAFRTFLYERVYDNPQVHSDFIKARKILEELYAHLVKNGDWFFENFAQKTEKASLEVLVTDFIAGMTDRYALKLYETIFMPRPWKVL